MRNFLLTATGFILICAASPAFAQMSPGGFGGPGGGMGSGPGGGGGPATPQPRQRVPDIAPPALPGAGSVPVATGPVVKKVQTGDPTTALFAAVNSGDYNAAQDAISRGANLYAVNPLGETPLDLSVSLNRSSITFLLLATRNETGGDVSPAPAPAMAPASARAHAGHGPRPHVVQAADSTPLHKTLPVRSTDPGTPNPAAGFLGFGPKS